MMPLSTAHKGLVIFIDFSKAKMIIGSVVKFSYVLL